MVATPIGNLADISLRALDVLAKVDLIACEDTRTTRKLLTAHGIAARLTAYHDHNAARVRPKLMERLECGEAVALVSDAGTPLISDPGYKLVAAAAEANVTVTAVPGASAALAALTVSGLPSDRFLFAGFLPSKSGARRRVLAELAPIPASLVIYESARRLPAALADMAEVLVRQAVDLSVGGELEQGAGERAAEQVELHSVGRAEIDRHAVGAAGADVAHDEVAQLV